MRRRGEGVNLLLASPCLMFVETACLSMIYLFVGLSRGIFQRELLPLLNNPNRKVTYLFVVWV